MFQTPAKKKRPSSAKKPKESSAVKTGGSSTNIKRTTNSDGQKMMDLTGKKFVCVRSFRGRVFVDIREYYEDKVSGELKPGKKGK